MKVLVLGANGQLGTDLCRAAERAGDVVAPVTHADLEVTDSAAVAALLQREKPAVVVNTTAFHKVEACEIDLARSLQVNAAAPAALAQECSRLGAKFVHFSTDYVFGGRSEGAYAEDERPAPLNVYGASKAAGEMLIPIFARRHFILRTTGLYGVAGSSGKGGNFVELMLRKAAEGAPIRVVHDQILTPSYTVDVAAKTVQLYHSEAFGLYHVTNSGQCSWYEFAETIFKLAGLCPDLAAVGSEAFPSPVRRPTNSVLAKGALERAGFEAMPTWKDALGRYLQEREQHASKAARA